MLTPSELQVLPAASALFGVVIGLWTSILITKRTLKAAQDERLWERRADAYVSVLAWLRQWDLERTRLRSSVRPEHGDPWPEDRGGLADVIARVAAFGSDPVRKALTKVDEADLEFRLNYMNFLRDLEDGAVNAEFLHVWTDDIDGALHAASAFERRLATLIRQELQLGGH